VRRNETRIGVLGFLAATLLVLGALVVFARYPAIFRTGREYHAIFRSVAGLNAGDEVRYGGLFVGTVTQMEIAPNDPTRVLVSFRVRRTTPIRVDTRASVSQVGLLGQPYLQLEPGRAEARALAAGGMLPSVDTPTFQDAMARLTSFFDRADTLIAGVEKFARASPLDRLDHTVARIDTLATVTMRGSTRAFAEIDQASQRLTDLIDRSGRLVTSLDTTVRRSGPGLVTTQEEALKTVRELRLVVEDMRDALQQEGGLDHLVRNMAVASDNIARLSERLERDPSSVLKKRATPAKPAGPKVQE
jgi:phospholipid/cholesterol/gamma-HCH transport system substrate-binding protein